MDITRELEYIFSIPQEYQFSITIVPPISSEESRMKNENDSNTSLEI